MATAGQVRAPRPFSPGDDFSLWIHHFEAYAQMVKIKDETMCDALLALLRAGGSKYALVRQTN